MILRPKSHGAETLWGPGQGGQRLTAMGGDNSQREKEGKKRELEMN